MIFDRFYYSENVKRSGNNIETSVEFHSVSQLTVVLHKQIIINILPQKFSCKSRNRGEPFAIFVGNRYCTDFNWLPPENIYKYKKINGKWENYKYQSAEYTLFYGNKLFENDIAKCRKAKNSNNQVRWAVGIHWNCEQERRKINQTLFVKGSNQRPNCKN